MNWLSDSYQKNLQGRAQTDGLYFIQKLIQSKVNLGTELPKDGRKVAMH